MVVGLWFPVRLIGYVAPPELEIAFDIFISVISCLNLYLHFRESKEDPRRWRSWAKVGLICDLLSALPIALVTWLAFGEVYKGLLLINLLAARHVRRIKPFLDQFDSLQPITYRLVPLAFMMPLLVHNIACCWIMLGAGTAGIDADWQLTYVKAIYWTFTTLTTVGYGDIAAKTPPQMLFTCAVQVMGVGVFGFILSNVASLLSRSDAAREHHMDDLDRIETFMRLHNTPSHLRLKIRSYYNYMWEHKKGYKDDALLEGLPSKIHSELIFHINRSIVERVPVLKGASTELLEDLMSELQSHVFVPDERIFRHGDPGDAMYFIHSGEVDILGNDHKVIASLNEGAFFGEMSLVSNSPRSATAKAKTFCDTYRLPREAFERVVSAYPDFKQQIERVVQQRKSA